MKFTSDWFSHNIPAWEDHLSRFRDIPCQALELGSFEGRSACWLLENILTHPESRIICVDNAPNHNLISNTSAFPMKASVVFKDATSFLRWHGGSFDIIYIDAHHIASDVILQAGLAWPMLNPGGVMIFDDYGNKKWSVKPAVDFFIEHWPEHTLLHKGFQVILQKPC